MKTALRLLSVFVVLLATGCASTVQPWERGTLSRADMQWEPDPMEAQLSQHVFFSKEASSGGGGTAGGGCGCN